MFELREILGNGSVVISNVENKLTLVDGMLLRSYDSTYMVYNDEVEGWFIIQRCGVLVPGTHPDNGKVFFEIHPNQEVALSDGGTAVVVRAPNHNLKIELAS